MSELNGQMLTHERDELGTLAFNQGCDARLSGLPKRACPYSAGRNQSLALAWSRGFLDVEKHYGEDVAGRWQFSTLPPVREGV